MKRTHSSKLIHGWFLLINEDKRSDVFLKERPEQYNCKA